MTIQETMEMIAPVSSKWLEKAKLRIDNLTKPRGSLGMLEEVAGRVAAIRKEIPISQPKKAVFVFVGDHGVVSEGVSAYPQEVTAQMVMNFLGGGAAINVLARRAGAEVTVINIGMKDVFDEAEGLIRKNVKRGTNNMVKGPAMSKEEAERGIQVGIEMAETAFNSGKTMIATGEMGIGNTTPSSALFASLLSVDVMEVTGRGTGLDEAGLKNKAEMIAQAINVNNGLLNDPISALAAVGGLEIAGICGLCLGGAARGMVVVVDGFISGAGALVAMRLKPEVRDYLFFSHRSVEQGHRIFFEAEGIRPLLDLDLRLGEGTGAAIAMQIIEDAICIFNEMATFEDVGIEPGA